MGADDRVQTPADLHFGCSATSWQTDGAAVSCPADWMQLGGLQPMSGVKGTKGLNLHRLLVPHKPVAALASTAVFVDNSGRCARWAVFIDELWNFCL